MPNVEINKQLADEAGSIAMNLDDFLSKIALQLSSDEYEKYREVVRDLFHMKKEGIASVRITA